MDTNVANFLAEMEIEDTVELTPLIDVIFQLLVFFMLTSTFMLPTIDLSLPRLGGETQVVDSKDIPRLEVDSSGQIRLNGQPINCLINDLKDGILENDVR
ncbi:biopolymer transporter ExbD, partial [Arthrospira platensis SPKY1]|nr:biopolymer transporter ExbD [Arthrospira platensis SPKY1]